jgi:ribosomal protein L29
MKCPRKSRNFSQRKMRRAVLPRYQQEEILRDWLNYLLDPAFSTTLRSSDTDSRLRGVRREIARLKSIDGCFVDENGSLYTGKAIANLEEEEEHLLCEKRNRTYECGFFGRTAPKELGNVEGRNGSV